MPKLLFVAVLSFSFFFAAAQEPPGYYTTATGLTCAPLKTALFNKISSATNTPLTNAEVLTAFTSTDVHRNDANTKDIIWDIYSDNPGGPEAFEYISQVNNCGTSIAGEGSCYNREHTFPQAWFGSVPPMISDLFALQPTDGYANGQHANYPYSEVTAPTYTSSNGSKLGTNMVAGFPTTGIPARAFEVNDAYKGDIARNYFYMVTRYESDVASWQFNSNANDVLNGTSWPSLDDWYIQLLYKWHLQDPVSQKEINRNEAIYKIQNNRNPYIDHPEYVALVWQCTGLLPVTLINFKANKYNESVVLNWDATKETNFKSFEIEKSMDGIHFTNAGVVNGQNLSNYSFTDNNLPNVKTIFYRLKLIDIDGKFTYSKVVSIRVDTIFSNALVYPNPAGNSLTIKLKNSLRESSLLKVNDIAGRIVLQQQINATQNNIQLDVQQLPPGRYFITIKNSSSLINNSFIITR